MLGEATAAPVSRILTQKSEISNRSNSIHRLSPRSSREISPQNRGLLHRGPPSTSRVSRAATSKNHRPEVMVAPAPNR